MKNKTVYLFGLGVVVVAALIGAYYLMPGKYDAFATCLGDKGAIFYGAFWCPHCQEQKQEFGKSVGKLPYIECSTPDGQRQTQVCIDKGITSYPTWFFSTEGTTTMDRVERVMTLEELSQKTSCPLP